MKITRAFRDAAAAFKAVFVLSGPRDTGGTTFWERVHAGWDAFWTVLTKWGKTDFSGLAADCAANPVSGRAMRLICDNASDVPLIAQRDVDEGDPEEVEDEPLLDAIEREGWRNVVTPYVWGLYCDGRAFFHAAGPDSGPNAGTIRRLRVLNNARYVRTEYDANDEPSTYHFTNREGRPVTYPADEVLEVRLIHPVDETKGLPILLSARRALTLVEEADVWNRGIAKGGGRVPSYFRPMPAGSQVNPDQAANAQADSDKRHLERGESNLPMFLTGSYEPFRVDVTPREADWLKGRQVAVREIAAVMGVPPTLLGDEKGGSLTDAGIDSEVEALFKLTITPLVNLCLNELSRWLCSEGVRVIADWDQVPALQEDIDAKFARYQGAVAAGLLTKKEGRVGINYDPDPDPKMVDDEPEPVEVEEEPEGDGQVMDGKGLPALDVAKITAAFRERYGVDA